MKLTPHEQKILNIIEENPEIIYSPGKRETVAKRYGLTEKTLRNRIAELKKRGLVNIEKGEIQKDKKPLITCLLYTSPSPRDRQKSRMPSSA